MNILSSFKSTLAVAAMGALFAAKPAQADVFEYTYGQFDLDHQWAVLWSINDPALQSQRLLSATLTIENIRDWIIEPDDVLYIGLMGSATEGNRSHFDNEVQPDYFAGSNLPLVTYHDLLPYTPEELAAGTTTTLTHIFNDGQVAFLNANAFGGDGNFGITLDPDCHFYFDSIKVTFTTEPVPEPGTLALFGLGLVGLGLAVRRKRA